MKADKILSSLCYFSVLFAPFLFPIIIFIVATGEVRRYAGNALWTHLVPYLALIIGTGALAFNSLFGAGNQSIMWIIICVCVVVAVYYFLLNFVRGIRILITD